MTARIVRSKSADGDLVAIWDYLAGEASVEIADFVIARLFEAMSGAADNPLLYRQADYRGRPRRINVFEYAIFYEPLADGDGIRIRRVLHGRRNLTKLLGRAKR